MKVWSQYSQPIKFIQQVGSNCIFVYTYLHILMTSAKRNEEKEENEKWSIRRSGEYWNDKKKGKKYIKQWTVSIIFEVNINIISSS